MTKKELFFSIYSLSFFLTIILVPSSSLAADKLEDKFFQANKFYSQGEYKKAALLYEKITNSGVKTGNIYYNLGNTYFKLGRKGKAILNYERALKLIPQDEDLSANISFVRSALAEAQPEKKLDWFEKVYIPFRDTLTVNAWAILLFVGYLAFFSVIIIAIFIVGFRKLARYFVCFSLILIILSFIFMLSRIRDTELNKEEIGRAHV